MLRALPSADVFAVLVIFARVGMAIAVLPGFSASYVPMRMRLFIALGVEHSGHAGAGGDLAGYAGYSPPGSPCC